MATAPYRYDLFSSNSDLCAGSLFCRKGKVPAPLPRILCPSPTSVNRACTGEVVTPPRIIDAGTTFSLTFVPVLRSAWQEKLRKPPRSRALGARHLCRGETPMAPRCISRQGGADIPACQTCSPVLRQTEMSAPPDTIPGFPRAVSNAG